MRHALLAVPFLVVSILMAQAPLAAAEVQEPSDNQERSRAAAVARLRELRQAAPPQTEAAPQLTAATGQTRATAARERSAAQMIQGLRRTQVDAAVLDPLTTSTQNSLDPQLTITADKTDGVTGHARFALALGAKWGASVTFAAPLSSGSASFADAAGLKSGASVSGAIKYLPRKLALPVGSGQCSASLAKDLLAIERTEATASAEQKNQSIAEALEWMRVQAKSEGAASLEMKSMVRQAGHNQLEAVLSSPTIVASPQRFWAAVNQDPTLVCVRFTTQLSVGFEANHHSIDYLGADGAKATFDDTSRAWIVAYGVSHAREWHPEEGKNLLTPVFYGGITVRNGDKITAGEVKSICVPIETGASECFDGPDTEPAIGDRRTSVIAEARIWTYRGTAGFNPKYTWAQTAAGHSDTWEVPIYLMRQVTDVSQPDLKFGASLIGGVTPGWRRGASSGNGWFVTVFLSKPFGLP